MPPMPMISHFELGKHQLHVDANSDTHRDQVGTLPGAMGSAQRQALENL